MDAVILAAVLVGLAAYVAVPLYRVAPTARGEPVDLQARRNALIAHLRELRWDHEAGLLSTDEYERQRGRVEAEAAQVIRELDSRRGAQPGD